METKEPEAGDPVSAGPPAAGQRRRLALTGVRGPVAKGRDFTRHALQDWGWDGTETSEDALLVVSELLTNASLHGGGCDQLVLTADESALRIEVCDGTTTLPARNPAPQRGIPGGRGLSIVERLSDRWGAQAHGTGKAVWAEIEASRLVSGKAGELEL
ncbi:ATP-binding protein [Streptomyces sp. NPDC002073]